MATIFGKLFLKCHSYAVDTLQFKPFMTLPCNEWLSNIKIKSNTICTYCNSIESISHFLIDCNATTNFGKVGQNGFNMIDYPHMHESILFAFPRHSGDAIAINYCILYAKHCIYREKLNNQYILTIGLLSYLSHFKYILKIEKAYALPKSK